MFRVRWNKTKKFSILDIKFVILNIYLEASLSKLS